MIRKYFFKNYFKKLAFILIFYTSSGFGQNLKGVVFNEKDNSPIESVNIYIKKIDKGTTTNDNGEFNLKLKWLVNKTDTICFSIVGYTTKCFTLLELQDKNYVVFLSEHIEPLNQVTITPNDKLKSKIHYNKLSSLKGGLFSFGSALIEDKIYVIGGDASYIEETTKKIFSNYGDLGYGDLDLGFGQFLKRLRFNPTWEIYKGNLQIYDIITDTWTTSDLKFRKRAYNNLNYYNNKIYIIGGTRLSTNRKFEYLDDKIEVFDLKTQTIIIDDTNPHQATNFASFIYDSNIIVMGGSVKLKKNGEKLFTNKSHIYNLESGYWYRLSDMSEAKEVQGVLIKNKIYLIGGSNNKPLKKIETYDLTTGKWTDEGELFHGIKNPALAFHGSIIYIFDDGKLYIYDINTKELNEYLVDLFFKSPELYFFNNKLYLLGGYREDEFSKKALSGVFSIDLDQFEKTKINRSKILQL